MCIKGCNTEKLCETVKWIFDAKIQQNSPPPTGTFKGVPLATLLGFCEGGKVFPTPLENRATETSLAIIKEDINPGIKKLRDSWIHVSQI